MKYYIKNFGCKVNQYEGELVAAALESAGYVKTEDVSEADVIVINTCVVTHRGERDAYRALRRALRHRKPGAIVAVIGCLPELKPVEAVDFYGNYRDFLRFMGLNIPALTPFQHRARPFLKVQEGCNFRCSYCIVPFVRGRSRSRPLDEIIHEAVRLRDAGYRELVITGTQVGDWGREWGMSLVDLLERLIEVEGVRFRLSSILPLHVTERLIDFIEGHPKRLVPHLHISLQSASDRILRLMRRPYRLRQFASTIQKLVQVVPDIAIGTDVIAGFPTETDEDFEATKSYLESSPICHVHVFEYSPRPGTEAEKLPQVPQHLRKRRVHALLEIAHRKKTGYVRRFVGRVLEVVAEKQLGDNEFVGTSENYIQVRFIGKGIKLREIYRVKIEGVEDVRAYGRVETPALHPTDVEVRDGWKHEAERVKG